MMGLNAQKLGAIVGGLALTAGALAQVAVFGERVYTMTGEPIDNGVVVIEQGRITAVGPAAQVQVPAGLREIRGQVVTPGLIDAHATVGLTGIYNYEHDQDQIEHSTAMQPELRAIDAYNPQEALVAYMRGFGITTVHTGHAPGELISGQTMIVKLHGNTVAEAVVRPVAAVAATLSSAARKGGGKSPGTRGKMMAMLREELLKAQAYAKKQAEATDTQPATRDLGMEVLARVLAKELPLLVTVDRAQDIENALRLQKEFGFTLWLDGAAESYLLIDEIKAAGVPVIVHPTMERAYGDTQNLSFATAGKLRDAGIPIALQSGFEGYVPKVRIVLFEAGVAAANGLGFDGALAAITRDAAKLLGIDDRVGALAVGKDGDVAVYDGDPFEYTTHCTAVVIDGVVVSATAQ